MQSLAQAVAGNAGHPVLIILSRQDQMVHRALPGSPSSRIHPFQGEITRYTYALGVLEGDTLLTNDGKQHIGTCGIPFRGYAEKPEDAGDVGLVDGPFWLSACGNKLNAYLSTVEVVVTVDNIAAWIAKVHGQEWKRLCVVCLLLKSLGLPISSYKAIDVLATREAEKIRAEVLRKRSLLQQAIQKHLEHELSNGTLLWPKKDYEEVVRQLRMVSDEELPGLVLYPTC